MRALAHRAGVALCLGLAACAGRQPGAAALPVQQSLPTICTENRPGHVVSFLPVDAPIDPQTVQGRVVSNGTGAVLSDASVVLRGDTQSRRVITDSVGRFRITEVSPGRYQLVVRPFGYETTVDTIDVPLRQGTLELRERAPIDLDWCSYAAELISEPPLTLARAESVSREVALPDDGRVRHTVTVSATADELVVVSRVVSVGRRSAAIVRLCYPSAELTVLRQFYGFGGACYGAGVALAPGDSFTISLVGRLRGVAGRYPLRMHAIDPSVTDVTLQLEVIPTLAPLPIPPNER